MLIREFVQNPAFDVNCYVKIFDSTKEAGWKGKIPVYDGYGAPVDTSEDILSMELSYVTTNQHEIILEGIHRDGVTQKEEPGKSMEGSEDILSMKLSYVTTNQHEIILEEIRRDGIVQKEELEAQLKGHKEEVRKALQALYDAAYQVNQITDEDDYEQFPDLLDESANVTNEFKSLGIVEDGIVSL